MRLTLVSSLVTAKAVAPGAVSAVIRQATIMTSLTRTCTSADKP
jgi:hypothetical protein